MYIYYNLLCICLKTFYFLKRTFKRKYNCNKPVLYINIIGGVGNRLFQIASGYSIAKKHNMFLKIKTDLSKSHNCQHEWIVNNLSNMFNYSLDDKIDESDNFITYKEKEEFKYSDIIIDKSKPTVLYGYFQSEDYFKEYRNDILQLFKIPQEIFSLLNNITNFDNLIAIHVRLGDFMSTDLHKMDLSEYYKTAISLAHDTINSPIKFIIVCKESSEEVIQHYPFLQQYQSMIYFLCLNAVVLFVLILLFRGGVPG